MHGCVYSISASILDNQFAGLMLVKVALTQFAQTFIANQLELGSVILSTVYSL